MNRNEKEIKDELSEALEQIKTQGLSDSEVDQAGDRVWAALKKEASAPPATVARIEGCADYQALFPEYLAHRLSPARKTLLEDHLRECVACRKVLWTRRNPQKPRATPSMPGMRPAVKWAIAACLIVAFGVFQYLLVEKYLLTDTSFNAVAEQIDGRLMTIETNLTRPVTLGEQINLEQVIRTGRDSNAVLRLKDGSLVEMKERSEISLDATSRGPIIRVNRGSIIVQAAKQREGHRLSVDAADCRVTVKGTVFSVTKGTKGARVSVIEGEVWVEQGKSTEVLKPGQQMSTHPSLRPVALTEEISWSRNVDQHLALLREFVTLGYDLVEGMASAELRYQSNLLPLVPEDAVFYAAFPNVTDSFGQAYDAFLARLNETSDLSAWWQEKNQPASGLTVEEAIARLRRLGDHLGQEIVVTVGGRESGSSLLILAEVKNDLLLRSALQDDIAKLNTVGNHQVAVWVDNPAELDPNTSDHLFFFLKPGLLAVSTSTAEIQRVALANTVSIPSTPFIERLVKAYGEGVGWLFAADMERLIGDASKASADPGPEVTERLGIADLQQLIVEQKSVNGALQSRAILGFNQPRRGMAAWLGEAGPMGGLDYVSPDAFAAACFLLKDPALVIDEIFAVLQSSDPEAWRDLLEFESTQGLDVREDLAVPLGTEFLFAVDGPLLPKPGWKIIVEVDDPARLQQTIEHMVAGINARVQQEGTGGLTLFPETTAGISYYRLTPTSGPEVTYMFWEGYLIMTPGAELLTQAVQYRNSGYTLANSLTFRGLFPIESSDQSSGIIYQNFMPLVGSLAQYVPEHGTGLTPEQVANLRETASKMPPTLVVVTGETNDIIFSGRGLPGLDFLAMAAFGNLDKMVQLSPEAIIEK
ncbi:MAG TPA: FecR domain-containing protein [Acidobacteriota bacterium]|nr:FecR domain-containing protein [Acidobacteriota bacterium]